jgi:hypothetical protein
VHAALRVTRGQDGAGVPAARVGLPLADVYLEFLAGRCRPNTVLAAAYGLKVFFSVVGKSPEEVRAAGRRIILLTVFRKTRSAEAVEVAPALQAQKTCEAEHGPAHDSFDREAS